MSKHPAGNAVVRCAVPVALLLLAAQMPAAAQSRPYSSAPYTNADVIEGFRRTVFGSEYLGLLKPAIVRKFTTEVRLHIDPAGTPARRLAVARFVRQLPGLIPNLRLRIVTQAWRANYRVHLTDRRRFRAVAQRVLKGGAVPASSQCLVVAEYDSGGNIQQADAIIATDRGSRTFERCLREEILQGLGPLNDDQSLPYSLFNDRSTLRRFRRFDRLILAMLYDSALPAGTTRSRAEALLPALLRRAIRRVSGR